MTEDMNTICPWCGYHHNAVSAVRTDIDIPDDGDTTLCFNCGSWCIFDSSLDGGLRKPTLAERDSINHDDDLVKLGNAWKTVKRQ